MCELFIYINKMLNLMMSFRSLKIKTTIHFIVEKKIINYSIIR